MADDYDHNHYFKMFMTKKEFVPDPDSTSPNDYIAIDYAYHYCPGCAETVKVKVSDITDAEE